LINRIFYTLKPIIPRRLQIFLRRQIAFYTLKKKGHIWPINPEAANPPAKWRGWPNGKKFALVLTHDVETKKGHDRCHKIMDLEEDAGLRSSFNFVPERYKLSSSLIKEMHKRGFEVGVHGLKQDGKLYASKKIFMERSKKINFYLKKWNAVGFRSPAMHHNLEWLFDLNIKYDASTFDTDPFEPQSDGVNTIFPLLQKNSKLGKKYLELPYTLAQDFTLFIILGKRDINVWEKKLDWIVKCNGMALLNTHPDYMNFNKWNLRYDEYPVEYFQRFLYYTKEKYGDQMWATLPKELTEYLFKKDRLRHE